MRIPVWVRVCGCVCVCSGVWSHVCVGMRVFARV